MQRLRIVLVGVCSLLSSWAWAQSSASRWDAKTLRLTGSTSGYVGFQAPASAGNTTYTWPSSAGTNGQFLMTNGSGGLTWGTVTPSPWLSNGSAVYYSLGNVGIGTSSPSSLLQVSGTVTATEFSGSGASLTLLNASNLATGTVPTARLGTGTANNTTFLRGDGTWAAPSVSELNSVTSFRLANGGSSGSCSAGNAGEIRWTGSGFQGCNGSVWLTFDQTAAGTLSTGAALASSLGSGGGFSNVTSSAGVGDTGNGTSTAWGDYDNDGDLDLYVINNGQSNTLYRNNGDSTFTNVTSSAGVGDTGNGIGCAWGDYDADGDLDLYVVNQNQANVLYRNNGNNTFTNVTSSAGVGDANNGRGCAWADYDGDGDLDLYVVNYFAANVLYRNNGNSTFTDVSSAAGVGYSGPGRGVAWGDYDGDGDLDLYVSLQNWANLLYRNNGNGTFSDVTTAAGVGDTSDSIGVFWADYDGDSDLDLYIANYNQANTLYRNNGNGTFTSVASAAGVGDTGASVGTSWADYDADGDIDFLVINLSQLNPLYRNDGAGTFTSVGSAAGITHNTQAQNLAWGDYDGDGDIDVYITNWAQANILYRNNQVVSSNTVIRVNVRRGGVLAQGVTARLLDANGNVVRTAVVGYGDGYAQSATPVTFLGLNASTSYTLRVKYPDGATFDTTLGTPTGALLTVNRP